MDESPQEIQEKPKEPKLNDINLKKTVSYHHLHIPIIGFGCHVKLIYFVWYVPKYR